jgi:voltage-gated potassium channel
LATKDKRRPKARKHKERLYEIIFEADTRAGKAFDIVLLCLIVLSLVSVMLESVGQLQERYGDLFHHTELAITGIFTLEYFTRMYVVRRPFTYIFSFYGLVDLVAILPTYLAFFFVGAQSLLVIRGLRLVRIFRIFKMARYTSAARTIVQSLLNSWAKISVFLLGVLTIVIIIGATMYLIEGPASGFDSIPKGIYWAIVTLTTVGFGDITPITPIGQVFASFVMLLGYAIIAVPTGIVTVEMVRQMSGEMTTQVCPECLKEGHTHDAKHCKYCGAELNPDNEGE